MRTGAIQSNAFPSNEKENLAQKAGFIPKEAIRASEEARNPVVRDEDGNLGKAKSVFRNGDPYSEDRISVAEPNLTEGAAPVSDENVMPG